MIDTKETKRLTSKWSEFYERPINEKEFDEISMNLGKFFSILTGIQKTIQNFPKIQNWFFLTGKCLY